MNGRRLHGQAIPLGVILVTAWLAVTAHGAPLYAFTGLGLAAGVAAVFGRILPRESEKGAARKRAPWRKAWVALRFLPLYGWSVFRAGLHIARLVLSPSYTFWPGIVRIKGGLPHRTATTLFGHLITLTPGTLTLDYDGEKDDLYIHWIDVVDDARVDMDQRVTSGMRPWLRSWFS